MENKRKKLMLLNIVVFLAILASCWMFGKIESILGAFVIKSVYDVLHARYPDRKWPLIVAVITGIAVAFILGIIFTLISRRISRVI